MVSEFSIQPFRSQEEAQAYREGVGALPAQAAWMAGLMAPSSGISDYLGLYPKMPTEEQMIPTEQMPSFGENIANKQYLDAILQSAGVLGDAAYASIPFTGPGGAIAGTALKGIGAVGKASKGAKAKGLSSLPESEDYITAYHGSAADFDKFDIGKIGTGVGSQMYGYGLYFTKSKKVAKEYAEERPTNIFYDGKKIIDNKMILKDPNIDSDVRDLILSDMGNLSKTKRRLQRLKKQESYGSPTIKHLDDLINKIDDIEPKVKVEGQGKVYQVELDIKEDELLDYSKPLDEQPNPVVRKKIESMPYFQELKIQRANELQDYKNKLKELENLKSKLKNSGSETIKVDMKLQLGVGQKADLKIINEKIENTKNAVRNVSKDRALDPVSLLPNNQVLAKNLESVGIKGVKIKQGDEMFVVFDPRVIDISKKFGVAIPVAGAMLLAQDEEMATAQNDSLDL